MVLTLNNLWMVVDLRSFTKKDLILNLKWVDIERTCIKYPVTPNMFIY